MVERLKRSAVSSYCSCSPAEVDGHEAALGLVDQHLASEVVAAPGQPEASGTAGSGRPQRRRLANEPMLEVLVVALLAGLQVTVRNAHCSA